MIQLYLETAKILPVSSVLRLFLKQSEEPCETKMPRDKKLDLVLLDFSRTGTFGLNLSGFGASFL